MTNKHVDDAGMHEHVSVPCHTPNLIHRVQCPAKCDPCSTLTSLNAFCLVSGQNLRKLMITGRFY
jgi:hypothetical protein